MDKRRKILSLVISALFICLIFMPGIIGNNERKIGEKNNNDDFKYWLEQTKILALDGITGDNFGISVSIDGDTAIIGAPGDDDNGQWSGSAYIFECNGTHWTQTEKLTPKDGAEYEDFGISVSIDGDTAIIGAYEDNDNGQWSGSAYIFQKHGDSWLQQAKLTANDGENFDFFGISVSIDGDTAIIGAPGDDDNGQWSGSAYIFECNGTHWTQTEKLTAKNGEEVDNFGVSVSIDGDTAIIGAPGDDDNGRNSGSAYVFKRGVTALTTNPKQWIQEAKLLSSDGEKVDNFGVSVSIDENTAIIGAPRDDDNGQCSGSAYIFENEKNNWKQKEKLTPMQGAKYEYFGISVSIDTDTVLIGTDNDFIQGSGSAYVFKENGSIWDQKAKLTAKNGEAVGDFGVSVSIDGNTTIIGAPGDNDKGTNSGSTYIFRSEIDNTKPFVKIITPTNALYIGGDVCFSFFLPVIIGKTNVEVEANDFQSGFDHIELYVMGKLVDTSNSTNIKWYWAEPVFGKHVIKAIAYDIAGNKESDKINVWKFF